MVFGCFECMAGKATPALEPNGPTEGSAAWAVALKYMYV